MLSLPNAFGILLKTWQGLRHPVILSLHWIYIKALKDVWWGWRREICANTSYSFHTFPPPLWLSLHTCTLKRVTILCTCFFKNPMPYYKWSFTGVPHHRSTGKCPFTFIYSSAGLFIIWDAYKDAQEVTRGDTQVWGLHSNMLAGKAKFRNRWGVAPAKAHGPLLPKDIWPLCSHQVSREMVISKPKE